MFHFPAIARAILLLVALHCVGCSDDLARTEIAITRTTAGVCRSTVDGTVRPMNSYMVKVYVIPNPGSEPPTCGACTTGDNRCALLTQRCTCGETRQTTVEEMKAALSGVRIAVERDAFHCVQVVGLELEEDVRQACKCPLPLVNEPFLPPPENDGGSPLPPDGGSPLPPDGGPPVEPPAEKPPAEPRGPFDDHYVRACLLSDQPTAAGETTITLELFCLDDRPKTNGGEPGMTLLEECTLGLPLLLSQ